MSKELKGIDELNEVFENFFAELGYPEIECVLETDFCYYLGTDEIAYTLLEIPLCDLGFRYFLEENYNYIPKCSMFVFSLLHELGHHITMPKISKVKMRKCEQEKNRIESRKADTPKEIIQKQIDYCSLFDEKMATDTAVKILIENYDFILEFEKVWFEAVIKFYQKNGIKNC